MSLGALGGSWRVFRRLSGHGFNRQRGTWGFGGGSGSATGFLEDPRAVPGLRRSSGILRLSSSARYQARGIWEDRGQTSGIESEGLVTHSEGFFHRRFPFPR